ncbi:hypothetical protein QH494_15405 [Sphingomonas sp. AR_OL41]|uniref:hypothetical protein n=1 Tax=Sphingomonas sp. AR_OL41 TaxID=3042729 RepID=UPI0024814F50|nr:hypothetical protein [Sphingomonas sp. AR_OL41]MDH7973577.1 hypothetical protein [Sphingomonas sp. AR_OL41]
MAREADPAMLLMRAIEADARRAGCAVTLARAETRRWSSATFTGARHALAIEAPDSPALEAWLERLPEAELPVRAQLVADLTIAGITREAGVARVAIEALTVGM